MTKVALIGAAAGLVGLAALALGYQAGRTDVAGAAPDGVDDHGLNNRPGRN